MNTAGIVIVIVLVVLALLAVGLILSARRKNRTERLQGRFGPEYDRAVDEHGNRRAAESHLADVADRRDKLEIRELRADQRTAYTERWTAVQASFVDDPAMAVRDADQLVGEVMRARGYPVDDFDTQSDMVAVDHPEVAEHYRRAHAVGSRVDQHGTEEQRQAFVHYRALFDELLGGTSAGSATATGTASGSTTGTTGGTAVEDRPVDLTTREERATADAPRDPGR